ncbi:MAG: cysteine desulfurase-like protein [Actinomycetota bacterium]|nr:cysteine desulfurase-like protein [Actinomycetota bacterium]
MAQLDDIRHRFPGLADGWARFDGPAGTQVLDAAIDAMADWQRSGSNANAHGSFPASHACDALEERSATTMRELLGAGSGGVVFGPSTTANLMALSRAVGRTLGPGDEVVCTTLDHDANVTPWLLAAEDSGATVRMAGFDGATGRLATGAVADLIGPSTRWVAVTGASNVIGTMPDLPAVAEAAHAVGARVVVDGVHRTPHISVDVDALGCDVYGTSSYKWYGPHAGVMWMADDLVDELPAYKVRSAPATGGARWQYGTASYEALAGIDAAARFLLDTGMDVIEAHGWDRLKRLLAGLHGLAGVRVMASTGPDDVADRAPTLQFLVEGYAPHEVAEHLAGARVAVWDGHNYAVEAMGPLGLDPEAGAVRAGISAYTSDEDVDRLLEAVAAL